MSIFQGLGRGLGAAAQGYLGGQNKAEAEMYRRQQLEENAELKRLAVEARRKEMDPGAETRKLAGQIVLKLSEGFNNHETQRILQGNPDWANEYRRRLAHANGVATGSIPHDQFDPASYGPLLAAIETAPGTEPPIAGTDAYLEKAPPVHTPKQTRMADQTAIGWAGAQAQQDRIAQNQPLVDAQVGNLTLKNEWYPRQSRADLENTKARTGSTVATAQQTRALTPVKVEQGKTTIDATKKRTALAEKADARAEATLRALERQRGVENSFAAQKIGLEREKFESLEGYREAQIKKINDAISRIPQTEEGKNDRAVLNYYGRILAGRVGIGPLQSTQGADLAPEAAVAAGDLIAKWGSKKQAAPKTGGKTAPKVQIQGGGFSAKDISDVKVLIKSGQFGQLLKGAKDQTRAKALYRQATGKEWSG